MHIILILTGILLSSCSPKEEAPLNAAEAQITQYTSNFNEDCEQEKKTDHANTENPDKVDTNPQTIDQVAKDNINPLMIQSEDMVYGDKNSKVVVIEYVSPTCPHCAYFHKTILPRLEDQYIKTNKIAYVVRNFIANKQDLDASVLAHCSKDPEKFMKFTNVILQQQDSWAITNKYREILTNIGRLGGVSAEDYINCLQDNNLLEFLMKNSKAATISPKFVGTPAFFINGEQFVEAYSFEALSKAIEVAIKKTQDN